jgi:CHAT domain-containing protein
LADGDISLAQIATDWRFDASPLVVLSACESGLIDLGHVDEHIGLPTSLLAAGASAVISTLWTVDDATTAMLMAEFYRRHFSEGEDTAVALGRAQLWLRDLERDHALAALEPGRAIAAGLLSEGDPGDIRMWAAVENLVDDLMEQWDGSDRPWSNPYFWAGFVHVGPGQLPESHVPMTKKPAQ